MRISIFAHIVILLALIVPASAETIYRWTDSDGILRFSNQQPPEGVAEYEAEVVPSGNAEETATQRRRASYDHMVERSSTESLDLKRQRQTEAAAKAAEQQRKSEARRQDRVQTERKQLEKQIEDIKKRGFGPTYTKGMQKAQIDKIRSRIKALKSPSESATPKAPNSRQSSY